MASDEDDGSREKRKGERPVDFGTVLSRIVAVQHFPRQGELKPARP